MEPRRGHKPGDLPAELSWAIANPLVLPAKVGPDAIAKGRALKKQLAKDLLAHHLAPHLQEPHAGLGDFQAL